MSPWLALSPLLLAFAGAIVVLGLDAFDKRSAAVVFGVLSLLAAGVLSGSLALQGPVTIVATVNMAVGQGYSAVTAALFVIAAITLIGGSKGATEVRTSGQIAALTMMLAVAGSLLISSRDLLIVIIALEGVAITSFALVSASRGRRADEAAMKYFVQSAVATGLALYALSVIYGLFGGSLSLSDISGSVGAAAGRPALLAMALLIGTYAFKVGAFPFHSWALDAYETTTPSTASFLATAPKIAVLGSLMVVLPLVGFSAKGFASVGFGLFALLATASVVFGNLGGLKQSSFTRMLAYSGVAQIGYALVGVAAAFLLASDGRSGFSVIFAGLAYSLAAAGAFMGAQAVRAAVPEWDGTVSGLAGLGRRRPLLSAALAVTMLSLTGIPLTAGFWGKYLVFSDAAGAGTWWLALIGMIGSVVSFGYYGGVIRSMYLDEAAAVGADRAAEVTPDMMAEAATLAFAFLVLLVGILPFVAGFTGLRSLLTIF